jgi:hypothetical protein
VITAAAYIGLSGERSEASSAGFRSLASTALMGLPRAASPMRTPIPGVATGGRQAPTDHVPLRFRSGSAHLTRERKAERSEAANA